MQVLSQPSSAGMEKFSQSFVFCCYVTTPSLHSHTLLVCPGDFLAPHVCNVALRPQSQGGYDAVITQVGVDDHIRIIMISFPVTLFRPLVIQCFPPPPCFASSLQLLGQLERTGSRPADKEMISFLPAIHVPSEQAAEFPSSPESSHRPPSFM